MSSECRLNTVDDGDTKRGTGGPRPGQGLDATSSRRPQEQDEDSSHEDAAHSDVGVRYSTRDARRRHFSYCGSTAFPRQVTSLHKRKIKQIFCMKYLS